MRSAIPMNAYIQLRDHCWPISNVEDLASTTFKSDIRSCANHAPGIAGDTETENAAMQVAYRANQFPVMVYTVTRKVRNIYADRGT